MSRIQYHCLDKEKHPKLYKEAEVIFNDDYWDESRMQRKKYIVCVYNHHNWMHCDKVDDYNHKEVHSLEELFSINPELHDKYMRSITKLGQLL